MRKVFIEQIRERDWVDSPFLVRDKIMAMAKNGKPYMTLKLMDRSGEIEGRVWDRVDEFAARFAKDDFIRVQGKTSVYLGKMQLIVQDIARLDEQEIDLADFLPVSARRAEDLLADLRALIDGMSDPHLKALMEAFWNDEPFRRAYATAPAAKAMHHVYLGGLLEHSLAVAALAGDICRRYPGIHRDLLISGALLHDIGKVSELCYRRSFDYTDEGKLLGHIVMGVEMISEKIAEISGFPPELGVQLKHLLLSHHGQYEYGSPKRPKTMEAVILNFLDDLDSKINGVRTHMEKEPDSESAWTSYHRLYDRYFFKNSGLSAQEESPVPVASEMERPSPRRGAEVKGAADKPTAEKPARERKKSFGFTLGDQLRGKNLDLFSAEEE